MIVDLKTISKEPKSFNFVFEKGFLNDYMGDDRILGIKSPVEVGASISRTDHKFLIEGHISGILELKCDRCLGPYLHTLDSGFRSYLTTRSPDQNFDEIELFEEDMELDFITNDEIDLNEIIWGNIFLALPMISVCDPECRGLCPECGTNLNIEQCDCSHKMGNTAFAQLKYFKPEGE
jgi:uncharacterized protein